MPPCETACLYGAELEGIGQVSRYRKQMSEFPAAKQGAVTLGETPGGHRSR